MRAQLRQDACAAMRNTTGQTCAANASLPSIPCNQYGQAMPMVMRSMQHYALHAMPELRAATGFYLKAALRQT